MIAHMNAVRIKKWKKLKEIVESRRYVMEEKFKGNRAWIILGSTNRVISRGGKDRTAQCPHIAHYHVSPMLHGWVLDAELYSSHYTDAQISGFLHRNFGGLPSDALAYVFDVVGHVDSRGSLSNACEVGSMPHAICGPHDKGHKGLIETQEERYRYLDEIFMRLIPEYPAPLSIPSPFVRVPREDVISYEQVTARFDAVVANGGEGLMLKNLDAIYHSGERKSNIWFKLKKSDTYDVIITGFTQAKAGKFSGLIGAVEYSAYIDGTLTKIGKVSGMSDGTRKSMTDCPETYIDKVMEVRAQEMLEAGTLKDAYFVRMRPDKMAVECVWEDK